MTDVKYNDADLRYFAEILDEQDKENIRLSKRIERLEKALIPFSQAICKDAGIISLDSPTSLLVMKNNGATVDIMLQEGVLNTGHLWYAHRALGFGDIDIDDIKGLTS